MFGVFQIRVGGIFPLWKNSIASRNGGNVSRFAPVNANLPKKELIQ
jgi:hypothetical protein